MLCVLRFARRANVNPTSHTHSETMGNATAVCSDKTGTLTQNVMTVVEGFLAGKSFKNTNEIKEWKAQVEPEIAELLFESIAVNSTAFEGKDDTGKVDFIGSKTESALLGFGKSLGYDYSQIRSSNPPVKVYPFASLRKTMTTVVKIRDGSPKSSTQKDYRVYVKGASEIVLSVRIDGIRSVMGGVASRHARRTKTNVVLCLIHAHSLSHTTLTLRARFNPSTPGLSSNLNRPSRILPTKHSARSALHFATSPRRNFKNFLTTRRRPKISFALA